MSDKPSTNVSVYYGFPWFVSWLFTVAFCHLGFGRSVLAMVVWPYYLGEAIASLVRA